MFTEAIKRVSAFTLPVVISSRTVKGTCRSVIGASVVINEQGWILTAAHILNLIHNQQQEMDTYRKYHSDVEDFEKAIASNTPHRKRKLRHFKRPGDGSVRNHSVWWGIDGASIREAFIVPSNDLALVRLEPFDTSRFQHFPVFRTPELGFLPGQSLCRTGYSFHEIVPTFDEENNRFVLPPGSVPLPQFPLESMLIRIVRSPGPEGEKKELGLFFETSTPGLSGQSGGPIFDPDGVVWGIQSHTRHYPLGFKPTIPGQPLGQVEHQFLNVGVGIHIEPILKLLVNKSVAHQRQIAAQPKISPKVPPNKIN